MIDDSAPERIWARAGFRPTGPFTSKRDWSTGRGDWALEASVYTSAEYIRQDIADAAVEAARQKAALDFLASEGQHCDQIDALTARVQELEAALRQIAYWRKDSHAHDDDCGHFRRSFGGGDVAQMERVARAAIEMETPDEN